MKPLRVADIIGDVCPTLRNDSGELVEAWRQAHYAAQAVAEVGKSWGRPKEDDSHSALKYGWGSGGLVAYAAEGFSAELTLHAGFDISMWRVDEHRERASIELAGRSLEEAVEWVRATASRWGGEARQEATPAPDLPEHILADGGRFAPSVSDLSAVLSIYVSAAHLLDRLSNQLLDLSGPENEHDLQPRLWPHHFDLASLFVAERDEDGSTTRTIGVGVTPPDDVESSGYWYVSPWTKSATGRASTPPALPIGRWETRGQMAMAVLPLNAVFKLADEDGLTDAGVVQAAAIAEFIATAFNACMDHFENS